MRRRTASASDSLPQAHPDCRRAEDFRSASVQLMCSAKMSQAMRGESSIPTAGRGDENAQARLAAMQAEIQSDDAAEEERRYTQLQQERRTVRTKKETQGRRERPPPSSSAAAMAHAAPTRRSSTAHAAPKAHVGGRKGTPSPLLLGTGKRICAAKTSMAGRSASTSRATCIPAQGVPSCGNFFFVKG